MPPDYASLQRSLSLLRRLLIGPTDRDTLAAYVEDEYDPGAYGELTVKAAAKRLENDLQRLRDWGVDLRYTGGDYQVVSLGDFSPVALDDAGLSTLAFLQETFAASAPLTEAVQALIARILDWLPPSQAASLPARRQRWQVDLQRSAPTKTRLTLFSKPNLNAPSPSIGCCALPTARPPKPTASRAATLSSLGAWPSIPCAAIST